MMIPRTALLRIASRTWPLQQRRLLGSVVYNASSLQSGTWRTETPRSSALRWLSTESPSKETSEEEVNESNESHATEKASTTASPAKEKIEFKAETRQILDIMTHSLYTDKELFLRELVSNASDALEKLRHTQAANTKPTIEPDVPLEIRIEIDEVTSTITITDTGIGMTRDEMIHNLGTIAKSGSKKFMEELKRVDSGSEIHPERGIIGRFGVGFYSVFMISEKVDVISRSALEEHSDAKPQMWVSDGNGFEVSDVEDDIRVGRGTSIKLWVDSDWWRYVNEKKLEEVINQYSNFIGFPIYLMGRKINTVQAIWTKSPNDVTEEEYTKFYRYIAHAVDEPLETIHFRAEAPIDVKALFFIPSFHPEKFGAGRIQPSVSLYCRKVLIEAKSPDILPDWMRFVKGVVDSEDLPLSVSREKAQDSNLIKKLRTALTRKFISHLLKMKKDDNETFVNEFYKEYNFFLKEGICQDTDFHAQLSKLLHFETSKNIEAKLVTFDDYISNMRPEQKDIYYLCAPSRAAALNSPYLETFEKAGVDVIFVYTALDDFVMGSLAKYEGRNLVTVEKSDIDLSEFIKKDEQEDDESDEMDLYKSDRKLTDEESVEFCNWYRLEFSNKIASCSVTDRLSTSPAIVTDHQSGALRRYLQMVDSSGSASSKEQMELPKQHLEVNPAHPIIVGIHELKNKEPILARVLAEQVYDNSLVAAGLMDDSRTMLPRLNDLLITLVKNASQKATNDVHSTESSDPQPETPPETQK